MTSESESILLEIRALRTAVEVLVIEIRRRYAQKESTARQRDVRLLSCHEVDRMYRKRKGTASAAYHNGLIKGRKDGKTIYVSAKRTEELWGAD